MNRVSKLQQSMEGWSEQDLKKFLHKAFDYVSKPIAEFQCDNCFMVFTGRINIRRAYYKCPACGQNELHEI